MFNSVRLSRKLFNYLLQEFYNLEKQYPPHSFTTGVCRQKCAHPCKDIH
jgi:hypothetical protein